MDDVLEREILDLKSERECCCSLAGEEEEAEEEGRRRKEGKEEEAKPEAFALPPENILKIWYYFGQKKRLHYSSFQL